METLMTSEAATTPEGQAASQTDAQAATAAVEGVQQQATEGQQAAPEAAQQPEVKPPEVPENYEFQPVEGSTLGPEVLERFGSVAKELKLSQEAAQKVLNEMAPAIQAQQMAQIETATKLWAEQSTADKEFGGEKLQENLTVAKRALDTFGTNELRALLNESGLGNHPEVVRFMVRAGKAISPDTYVAGVAPAQSSATDARYQFPASNMNP